VLIGGVSLLYSSLALTGEVRGILLPRTTLNSVGCPQRASLRGKGQLYGGDL
jgi:hypothetical protein